MKQTFLFALFGLLVGSSVAFAQTTKAIAVLHPTQGSNVGGTVTFTASGDEVKVVADITGLTAGKHGFHIHEFGDCSDPKAASAGGPFYLGAQKNSAAHEGGL